MKEAIEKAALAHQKKFPIDNSCSYVGSFGNGMHHQSYKSFIAGAEFGKNEALKRVKRRLMALLTNIPHSEEYVDPNWYTGEIDIVIDEINKLLKEL